MRSLHPSSALLLTFLATVNGQAVNNGAPAPHHVPQQGTSINLVAAGPLPMGPVAMKQTYLRFNKPAPNAVIAAAAAATQSGTVQATNLPYDQAYIAPVTVGRKNMHLNFDTGSSDLWVFSTALPQSQRNGHVLYGLGGQVLDGYTWDISYGDGSGASGNVYADKVVIGGVSATVQAVEAATSVSTKLVNSVADGLVGLGFDAGNTCQPGQCYTFMHQVGPTLPLNLFTATLRKGAPGTYDFGFLDSSKYSGTIAYAKINHSGSGSPTFWEFVSPAYSIGSGAKVAHSSSAIADTGTSLAYLDQAVVNDYYAQVSGARYNSSYGGVVFPCASALPTLSLFIGQQKRTMPGSYAKYQALNDGLCYGGIQSNTNIGFSILGDVFLKSQYVVFDLTNNRVGFAQQK